MQPCWIIVVLLVAGVGTVGSRKLISRDDDFKPYDYESHENGPHNWPSECTWNTAAQSPIDIITKDTDKPEDGVPPLLFEDFDEPLSSDNSSLYHVGHTIEIFINGTSTKNPPTISGALMKPEDKYYLYGITFHWGRNYTNGSEHRIDHNQYAMETNWVFLPSSIGYPFRENAYSDSAYNGQLVLLRILYKISLSDNPAYRAIVKGIGQLKKEYDETFIVIRSLQKLLPENLERFWIYKGSETYPPCFPKQWVIVMEDTVPISEWQIHGVWQLNNWWFENQMINITHRKPVGRTNYQSITYRSSGQMNCACLLWVVLPLIWFHSGALQFIDSLMPWDKI